jgi:D-hydroxyproline dehydrogenase subunit alpha
MSFTRETDIAIVGGGPAGLHAARFAAEFKVRNRGRLPHDYTRGDALLDRVRAAGIEILNDALVWGAFHPGELTVRHGGDTGTIRSRKTIIASGAYERAAAFPGWDLPGVMTPGGAQALVKGQRVLPGSRIVLAGSGPFLLPVATTLIEAGANRRHRCNGSSTRREHGVTGNVCAKA